MDSVTVIVRASRVRLCLRELRGAGKKNEFRLMIRMFPPPLHENMRPQMYLFSRFPWLVIMTALRMTLVKLSLSFNISMSTALASLSRQ